MWERKIPKYQFHENMNKNTDDLPMIIKEVSGKIADIFKKSST